MNWSHIQDVVAQALLLGLLGALMAIPGLIFNLWLSVRDLKKDMNAAFKLIRSRKGGSCDRSQPSADSDHPDA